MASLEPTGAPLPPVLGDSRLQSQTLESVASAVNYHAWVTGLVLPHLGPSPIELGSGLGDYAQRWLDTGVPRITVTEADPSRLGHLTSRFGGDERVEVLGWTSSRHRSASSDGGLRTRCPLRERAYLACRSAFGRLPPAAGSPGYRSTRNHPQCGGSSYPEGACVPSSWHSRADRPR